MVVFYISMFHLWNLISSHSFQIILGLSSHLHLTTQWLRFSLHSMACDRSHARNEFICSRVSLSLLRPVCIATSPEAPVEATNDTATVVSICRWLFPFTVRLFAPWFLHFQYILRCKHDGFVWEFLLPGFSQGKAWEENWMNACKTVEPVTRWKFC